jgi:chitodextrinase
LKAATSYKIKVRAYDSAGNFSAFNQEIVFSTVDKIKPPAPTAVKVTDLTAGGVRVTWNASVDASGIRQYEIFIDGQKSNYVAKTTTIDIKDFKKTTGRFQVRAVDKANNISDLSSSVNYLRKVPLTVKGKTISVNGRLLKLSPGVAPVVRNNVVYLPYRPIFDALLLKTTINTKTKAITGSKTGYSVEIIPGQRSYKVNGKTTKNMTVAPITVNGTVYLPSTFYQQELNMNYTYSAK